MVFELFNQYNHMITIIEKPEWVSWDEIHDVLSLAHEDNRNRGVNMRKPALPGNQIAQEIGNNGKMFVAMDGNRVIGTAAIVIKKLNYWCGSPGDEYACVYFASVLPDYRGQGIFKLLDIKREEEARTHGINKLLGDTHERNIHRLEIAKKSGYKFVSYKDCRDHFNIVMVKWLDGCPYSDLRCSLEFYKSKILLKLRRFLHSFICKVRQVTKA